MSDCTCPTGDKKLCSKTWTIIADGTWALLRCVHGSGCRPRRNSRVGRGGGNGRSHRMTVMAVAATLLTAAAAAAAATTANRTRHHPRKRLANRLPRRLMRGLRLLAAARVPAATATSLCCGDAVTGHWWSGLALVSAPAVLSADASELRPPYST
jgi:hypothetical protein